MHVSLWLFGWKTTTTATTKKVISGSLKYFEDDNDYIDEYKETFCKAAKTSSTLCWSNNVSVRSE